jgi:hypothetical protein
MLRTLLPCCCRCLLVGLGRRRPEEEKRRSLLRKLHPSTELKYTCQPLGHKKTEEMGSSKLPVSNPLTSVCPCPRLLVSAVAFLGTCAVVRDREIRSPEIRRLHEEEAEKRLAIRFDILSITNIENAPVEPTTCPFHVATKLNLSKKSHRGCHLPSLVAGKPDSPLLGGRCNECDRRPHRSLIDKKNWSLTDRSTFQ